MSDTKKDDFYAVAIIAILLCAGVPTAKHILENQDRIESKIDHLITQSIQSKDTTNDD